MAKKTKKSAGGGRRRSAKQIAERAKPRWKSVTVTTSPRRARGDQVQDHTPELEDLRRKYLGDAAAAPPGGDAAGTPTTAAGKAKAARNAKKSDKAVTMVVMEPKTATDLRLGRKVVVVDDETQRVVGEQG